MQIRNIRERNLVQIWIGLVPGETEADWLAVPLADCGTGVGQVLALTTVLVCSETPRTILIDEPASYLHPGAVLALADLLREPRYAHHQYVLTSHSASLLTALAPEQVLLLNLLDGRTVVEVLDTRRLESQRKVLQSTGSELGDVFGKERVLWVEGESEEDAFVEIARGAGIPLARTAIRRVVATGDFEGAKTVHMFKVYESIYRGDGLVPGSCGLVLDRERRTPREIAAIEAEYERVIGNDRRLRFLQRTMLENYLLSPAAIAHVLGEETQTTISPRAVESFLTSLRAGPHTQTEARRLYWIHSMASDATRWLRDCHGARVINAVFVGLTGSTVQYDPHKRHYAVRLVRWQLEHERESLSDLVALLAELLGR